MQILNFFAICICEICGFDILYVSCLLILLCRPGADWWYLVPQVITEIFGMTGLIFVWWVIFVSVNIKCAPGADLILCSRCWLRILCEPGADWWYSVCHVLIDDIVWARCWLMMMCVPCADWWYCVCQVLTEDTVCARCWLMILCVPGADWWYCMYQVLTDDRALYRWLCKLEDTGLYLLTQALCETGQLKRLGDRVAFLRKACYGYSKEA